MDGRSPHQTRYVTSQFHLEIAISVVPSSSKEASGFLWQISMRNRGKGGLLKNDRMNFSGNDESILAALARLEKADKKAEKGCRNGCLSMFVAALGIILVSGNTDSGPERPLIVTVIILALMLFFISGVFRIFGSGRDYEDARYHLLTRLHKFFSLDCASDSLYSYQLDFRSYTDKAFLQRKEPFGTKGFLGSYKEPYGDISYYTMPMLTGRIKLKNGISLSFEICRKTAYKTVTKRGSSGKVKTKSKAKSRDICRVRVKLPATLGPAPLEPLATSSTFAPSYKTNGSTATVIHVAKHVHGKVPDGDQLLQTMAWLFYQLQATRASAPKHV